MKTSYGNFNMVIIILFNIFFGVSCSSDKDLLADAILSNSSINEYILVNDYFRIQPDKSIVLDVLSNDGFLEDDNVQITEISSPTNGSVEINDDNISIIYTPQSVLEETQTEGTQTEETQIEEASQTEDDEVNTPANDDSEINENNIVTDTFIYTAEVINEDETTSSAVGIVEIVLESSEEESTTDDENEENSSNDPTEGNENSTVDNTNQTANLLFSSGFEGVSLSSPRDGYQYLSGNDNVTGFNWPMRILGSDFSGIHRVNDDAGKAIENRIESTAGPKGNQTSTLFQQVKYDVQVTQTPYQINNVKENPKELHISYWMKTDDTAVKGIDKWRAIWEYKTDKYASNKDGFRMIAFMATDYEGKPYWLFQGDTSPQNPVWQVENYDIPLIMNEWFKVEYYIKWSDGSDGYASMKINGQLIGEHYGATTANSDDMDFIMLTQVYGNSYPMHQWVDDIEIWDGKP